MLITINSLITDTFVILKVFLKVVNKVVLSTKNVIYVSVLFISA